MGKKLLKIHQVDYTNEEMTYRWYPVLTAINYERKVGNAMKQRFESMGAGDKFAEVLVPIKEWQEISIGTKPKKDGSLPQRKVNRSENVFLTGYIFIKMIMDNSTWNIVRQTSGVAGYLKADGLPSAIEEHEVMAIKERLGEVKDAVAQVASQFKGGVGDTIKIKTAGNMEATITEVHKDKGIVKAISALGIRMEVDMTSIEVV
ncbi:MAG: hypothetical protein K0R18_280 [Bacillales bacterium]|jgi:transcriptional antiterminator NusG|nr:hypothetical protein [Bacillales bacterium]